MSHPSLRLPIHPTPHTAAVVGALRRARDLIPCGGSLCAALDAADSDGELSGPAYREALAALEVGALVFGAGAPTRIGAHDPDAAGVVDVAIYHLTGAVADVGPALAAFRRAAGPPLQPTLS